MGVGDLIRDQVKQGTATGKELKVCTDRTTTSASFAFWRVTKINNVLRVQLTRVPSFDQLSDFGLSICEHRYPTPKLFFVAMGTAAIITTGFSVGAFGFQWVGGRVDLHA